MSLPEIRLFILFQILIIVYFIVLYANDYKSYNICDRTSYIRKPTNN